MTSLERTSSNTLLDYIGFTSNWNNNLNCTAFTTIRLHNPSKYILHQRYRLQLKGNEIGDCKIVAINDFYLKNLTLTAAYIDTGYNLQQAVDLIRNFYPSVDFEKQKLSLITILKEKQVPNNPG